MGGRCFHTSFSTPQVRSCSSVGHRSHPASGKRIVHPYPTRRSWIHKWRCPLGTALPLPSLGFTGTVPFELVPYTWHSVICFKPDAESTIPVEARDSPNRVRVTSGVSAVNVKSFNQTQWSEPPGSDLVYSDTLALIWNPHMHPKYRILLSLSSSRHERPSHSLDLISVSMSSLIGSLTVWVGSLSLLCLNSAGVILHDARAVPTTVKSIKVVVPSPPRCVKNPPIP
jgi:hypothetical protein